MNPCIKNDILKYIHDPVKGANIDLSKEILINSDYEFIAGIIKKAPYLQKIIFSNKNLKNINFVLQLLDNATQKNSALTEIHFQPTLNVKQLSNENLCLYKQIQSRLDRNSKRIFGIHGGGNIGLGLMADIVEKSPIAYQILATTSQPFLKTLINANNEVILQHGGNASKITKINKISMITRDEKDILNLYQNASMAAICLTSSAFTESANKIALGLVNRFRADGSGLKILVLMNKPNSAEFVKNQLIKEINILVKDPHEANSIIASMEIIPTVVDRIVTRVPDNQVKSQIKEKLLSHVSKEFISAESLQKQIDKIIADPDKMTEAMQKLNLQINLFNAETQFAQYVPTGIPELNRFPAMKQVKKLEQVEIVKNKLINGPHAILAWLGSLKGCTTIAEAIRLPGMKKFLNHIIMEEIAPVLKVEYPELSDEELMAYKNLFMERCMESKDDPVIRVARDPLRKIESGGRIRGTLELHRKHGLGISTTGLELGMAAAVLYAINGHDRSNYECQKMLEIYKQRNSFKDVLCYQGSYTSGHYTGLDSVSDDQLIKNIVNKIITLQANYKQSNTNLFSNLITTSFSVKNFGLFNNKIAKPADTIHLESKPMTLSIAHKN